ncbi:MAG: hypothetical protein MK538_15525, partial [Planctomycetes bacterium]|nr:hypothetical protein [Planctomycetota bacterium]
NADGKIDITDAIVVLRWIVGGTSGVSCGDAIDANDSGSVGIEDAIVILNYLFDAASPSPAPPFTDCGVDPSADSLDCAPTGPCA